MVEAHEPLDTLLMSHHVMFPAKREKLESPIIDVIPVATGTNWRFVVDVGMLAADDALTMLQALHHQWIITWNRIKILALPWYVVLKAEIDERGEEGTGFAHGAI